MPRPWMGLPTMATEGMVGKAKSKTNAAQGEDRRTFARGRLWVGCLCAQESVPIMDLSVGEAPMTRRHKRKAWVQAKRKVKEAQADGNSAEEEAGTEDVLDLAGRAPATRREVKPNLKYLGPESRFRIVIA